MRLLLFLSAILLTVSGCANQSVREQSSPPQTQVSDHLEQLAKSVPHVRDANCVVIGNTAVVGIDVSGDLDRARVGTIKYSVAEALHKDPFGIDAVVTADLDIRNRLKEIGDDIRAGRPVSGFAEELADIIGRIMPQLPRDIDQG